jgi:hypothetical protein
MGSRLAKDPLEMDVQRAFDRWIPASHVAQIKARVQQTWIRRDLEIMASKHVTHVASAR